MQYVTQIGLILDILGVIILFKYGMPSEYIKLEDLSSGLIIDDADDAEIEKIKKKNKLIFIMSRIGLVFLILGFILQFIGSMN